MPIQEKVPGWDPYFTRHTQDEEASQALEQQLQRKLDATARAWAGGGNGVGDEVEAVGVGSDTVLCSRTGKAEVAIVAAVGLTQVWMVEHVEGFCPELQPVFFGQRNVTE